MSTPVAPVTEARPRRRRRALPRLPWPPFYYELVRLARRGRPVLLRCGFGALLLLGLYLLYHLRLAERGLLTIPPATTREIARIRGRNSAPSR